MRNYITTLIEEKGKSIYDEIPLEGHIGVASAVKHQVFPRSFGTLTLPGLKTRGFLIE